MKKYLVNIENYLHFNTYLDMLEFIEFSLNALTEVSDKNIIFKKLSEPLV